VLGGSKMNISSKMNFKDGSKKTTDPTLHNRLMAQGIFDQMGRGPNSSLMLDNEGSVSSAPPSTVQLRTGITRRFL